MIKNKTYYIFWLSLIIFIISKLLWGTFLISLFLAISIIFLFYLGKSKGKNRIFAIIVAFLISWLDLLFFILLLVPTKSFNIDTSSYYKNKVNYMKVFVKKNDNLNNLNLIIYNNWKKRIKVNLKKQLIKREKIILKQWDKIYFICKVKTYCKLHKSFAAIYLWDDSIFRIKPWTIITLKKITKNLHNLSDSKTNISIEKWNLWFHVIRLIKDSSSMKIETWKWQSLIIRWTAWFIIKNKESTYALDYSHYIEVKNNKKSIILKEWEWAEIKEWSITIDNIENIINKIWIDKNIIKKFESLDKTYIKKSINDLKKYIKNIEKTDFIWKMEELKIKIFSIWNKKYEKYLENLENIKYLIWKTTNFTKTLSENPNLAFLSANLEKTQVKLNYLYNEYKKLWNKDIYKTYFINMWIAWKIDNFNEKINKLNLWKKLEDITNNLNNLMKNIDQSIDNTINNFNFKK